MRLTRVFRNSEKPTLLLSIRRGRYGDLFRNDWRFFAHDGTKTRGVPLDCERIVHTLVKDDRLILLLERQRKYVLVEFAEFMQWCLTFPGRTQVAIVSRARRQLLLSGRRR